MSRKKSDENDFGGDLQGEVMNAVWHLGEARVEDVREAQPKGSRSANATIQTVLTRLVERGLLCRERRGRAYYYRARLNEADYLSGMIGKRLADATPDVRKAALLNVVGDLDEGELD